MYIEGNQPCINTHISHPILLLFLFYIYNLFFSSFLFHLSLSLSSSLFLGGGDWVFDPSFAACWCPFANMGNGNITATNSREKRRSMKEAFRNPDTRRPSLCILQYIYSAILLQSAPKCRFITNGQPIARGWKNKNATQAAPSTDTIGHHDFSLYITEPHPLYYIASSFRAAI